MLFDLFIGGLEMLADTIEYGPAKAFEINTSVCPQAERDTLRITRELQKELNTRSVYDDGAKPERKVQKVLTNDISHSKKHTSESAIDKEEEAIINQAVAERSEERRVGKEC